MRALRVGSGAGIYKEFTSRTLQDVVHTPGIPGVFFCLMISVSHLNRRRD